MDIKKLIVSRCNSLNLLEVGELTPIRLSALTPGVDGGNCTDSIPYHTI